MQQINPHSFGRQTGAAGDGPALLSVRNIEVVYDDVILVLRGVSVEVSQGSVVALLGANGAGKSTALKAISGLLKSEDGEVRRGEIVFENRRIDGVARDQIVRRGIFQIMEGRRIIADMTPLENLRLGAFTRRDNDVASDLDMVLDYFPRLKERTGLAGYLSGGEQQMLAIGRALMARPTLILMDEPSTPPCSWTRCSRSFAGSTTNLASASCWSNRMLTPRCRWRVTATSWIKAKLSWTGPPTPCATTRMSRNSTLAASVGSARISRASRATRDASGGSEDRERRSIFHSLGERKWPRSIITSLK